MNKIQSIFGASEGLGCSEGYILHQSKCDYMTVTTPDGQKCGVSVIDFNSGRCSLVPIVIVHGKERWMTEITNGEQIIVTGLEQGQRIRS